MNQAAYICVNGDYVRSELPVLSIFNRGFRFGDVLTENIHACSTEGQFIELHLERLKRGMKLLCMEVPGWLNTNNINNFIVTLLNKNRIFGGALIRLYIYRNNGELLVPDHHSISFIIESSRLDNNQYILNDKGFTIDICTEIKRPGGVLSSIHNAASMHFLLAALQSKKTGMDDLVLLNDLDRITETIHSNIFLVSGKAIFTPGLDQGCIPGVMRQVIIQLAENSGYTINDQSSLSPAALIDAEEIFLTNAIEGIRWVLAFRQKRYYKRVAKVLLTKLNEQVFSK